MNYISQSTSSGQVPRLLRLKEVLSLIPVSRSTFYEGIKTGRFPAPAKNGRISFWRSEEIAACISNPENVSIVSSRDVSRLAENSSVFQSDISAFLEIGRLNEILLLAVLTRQFEVKMQQAKPNKYDMRCLKRAQARLKALEGGGWTSLDILGYWRPD